jgi:predicted  nucleic acid-binding Zn-ribbon protein
MEHQIVQLARLAHVDSLLDDLHDDLGDLPVQVKYHEDIVRDRTLDAERTQTALRDIDHLRSTAHVTMQELTDKEQRLSGQQFQVKNNREFDAITREIEHIKVERADLEERLRTASVREENLRAVLAQQEAELAEAREKLVDKEKELEEVSGDQNDELRRLISLRKKLAAQIDNALETEYERIRTFHREAVVVLRKNSCSGCYSAVPSQRIMEMKKDPSIIHSCENCGRMVYTEELVVNAEEFVEENAG